MINLLKLIPGLVGIIPSPITVYLMLAIAAGSFAGGGWVVYKFWQAAEVTAVNEARATERDAVLIGDQHSKGVLDRGRQRLEVNRVEIEALRARLARVKPCPVPVPAAWLRRDQLPRAAPAPASPRPADSPVDPAPAAGVDEGPVADARDVVLTCERNRTEVYQPEADERAAARAWYNDLRARFNR